MFGCSGDETSTQWAVGGGDEAISDEKGNI